MTGDWFGNVFTLGRRDYFIFVGAKTLISVVTRAASNIPLPEFVPALFETLWGYGVPEAAIQAEFERLGTVAIARTNDRRVLGSLGDMVRTLTYHYEREGGSFDPATTDMRRVLWETPMSLLDMDHPADAVLRALGGPPRTSRYVALLPSANTARADGIVVPPPAADASPAGASSGGVDTRFIVRALLARAEADSLAPVDLWRASSHASRNPGGDLAWLAAYDPQEAIARGADALLCAATGNGAPGTAEQTRRLRAGAIQVFRQALQSATVSGQRKVLIGSLLRRLDAGHGE